MQEVRDCVFVHCAELAFPRDLRVLSETITLVR